MSIRSIAAMIVTVTACAVLLSCNIEDATRCRTVDWSKLEMSEWERLGLEMMGGGPSNKFIVCKIGSYYVTAPESGSSPALFIRNEQEVIATIAKNGNVHIFEDGRPLVDLYDRDDDGSFDWLSYEIYRDGDDGSLIVVDNNLDGQADHKYEKGTGDGRKGWLWFDGSWRPQKWFNAPEPNRILVDGVWRRHERGVEGELVLLDDE